MGFHYWTVGQRSKLQGNSKQLFVLRKEDRSNSVLVTPGTDHLALFTNLMYTEQPYWIDANPFQDNTHIIKCNFRFQHTKPLVECLVVKQSNNKNAGLLIMLKESLRAVTAGQYAVFYKHEECLGSARILNPGPSMQFYENGTQEILYCR